MSVYTVVSLFPEISHYRGESMKVTIEVDRHVPFWWEPPNYRSVFLADLSWSCSGFLLEH